MFWSTTISILLGIFGCMLMFVILLQRGRGGGLAGAFGGLGGQSAFGTKAGDVFTRITIGMAIVWVALASILGFLMRWETTGRFADASQAALEIPEDALPGKDGKAAENEGFGLVNPFERDPEKVGAGGDANGGPVLTPPGEKDKDSAAKGGDNSKDGKGPVTDGKDKPDGKKPETGASETKPAEQKPAGAPKADEKGIPK